MTTQFDSLSNIGRRYLDRQATVNNGELMSLFMNGSETMAIEKYFKQLIFNSTRYIPVNDNGSYQTNNLTSISNPNLLITGLSIFWLCTFVVLIVFLLGVSIYQCCQVKKSKNQMNEGVITFIKNKSRIPSIKNTWKRVLTCLIIISGLLWIIFFCLVCVEQSVISAKLSQKDSNNSNENQFNSLTNTVNLSFNYIEKLYNVIIKDSLDLINNLMNQTNTSLTNQIQISIAEFLKSILQSFKVTNIFSDATNLLKALNSILASMNFIQKNYQAVFSQISQIRGSISVYQSTIANNLGIICNKLERYANLGRTCNELLVVNSRFKSTVNTVLINSESSVITEFLLQRFKINITDITVKFKEVNSTFYINLDTIFKSSASSINVSSQLGFLAGTWSATIIPSVTPVFNSILQYKNQISTIMSRVITYESVTIILLIVIILVLIVLVVISFIREIFDSNGFGKWGNFSMYFLNIFFAIVSALVAILLIIAANFINIQVCRQFNTTDGIALTDQMINDQLRLPWKNIANSLLGNTTSIRVQLKQPTNILSGINTRCRNSSIGLFYAMGMNDFVNVSQVLQSGNIMNTIKKAQESAWVAFLKVNLSQIIPTDLKSFLDNAGDISTYFDSVNYSSSITQLSIPLVGIVDYIGFFNSLQTFVQNSIQILGNTAELSALSATVNLLLQSIASINETQNSMNSMLSNYQDLQMYRNNSQLIKQLMNNLNDAEAIFKNNNQMGLTFNTTFFQIISTNMLLSIIDIVNNNITSLTNQLLPCGNASFIVEAITTSLCSTNNMKDSLASMGIILIITTIICEIMTIIAILSTIFRLKFPKNMSKC